MARALALVFAGGCLGGALRIGLLWAVPDGEGTPWVTIAINLAGAALLGLLAGRAERLGHPWWYPAAGPGLLGGFTTFSALAVLPWTPQTGPLAAVGILAGTILGSALLAGAAWAVTARTADAPRAHEGKRPTGEAGR